jgi:hypothetical protein
VKRRPLACLAASLTLGLVAAVGCKSAGKAPPPAAPAAPAPEFIGSYVGQNLILRHYGAQQLVSVTRQQLARPSGDCDAGVTVREASFAGGTASFKLEDLGPATVPDKTPRATAACGTVSAFLVNVSGFVAGDGDEAIQAALDKLLMTPEAYLAANGVAFDRPPGPDPQLAASQERNASFEERTLARQVKTWPRPLVRVEPFYRDPAGRVRHQGEVEFNGVVGEDGRLRSPKLRTPLSTVHEEHVQRALSLWRYDPAQTADTAVAARILGRCTFRVY